MRIMTPSISFEGAEAQTNGKPKKQPATIQYTNENLRNNPDAQKKFNAWYLSIFLPLVGLSLPGVMAKKLVKPDNELGIKNDNVEKLMKKLSTEIGFEKKGITADIINKTDPIHEVLLKNYGGAAHYYIPSEKKNVAMAIKEKASLIFHEIGHAINVDKSKVISTYRKIKNNIPLPKMFKSPYIIISTIAAGLLSASMSYDNSKKNEQGKVGKFIHNNLVALTSLLFAPYLIEETLATSKAFSLLKKHSSDMLKAVKKNYLVMLSTYFLTAAGFIGTAAANRHYTDKLKKPQKEI